MREGIDRTLVDVREGTCVEMGKKEEQKQDQTVKENLIISGADWLRVKERPKRTLGLNDSVGY